MRERIRRSNEVSARTRRVWLCVSALVVFANDLLNAHAHARGARAKAGATGNCTGPNERYIHRLSIGGRHRRPPASTVAASVAMMVKRFHGVSNFDDIRYTCLFVVWVIWSKKAPGNRVNLTGLGCTHMCLLSAYTHTYVR